MGGGLQPARGFSPGNRRGAALITVLWLTTALAVIGFTVARTVREETQRTENLLEGSRASFLARGAIERMRFFLRYPINPRPNQPPPPHVPGQQRAYWNLPGGDVLVELLAESGKININTAPPQLLGTALAATGMQPMRIQPLVNAIVDWRTPTPPGLVPASTFWVRHASFEQIEELLLVPGVTSDLYFGYRDRLPGGESIIRPGLRDMLSMYGSDRAIDVNSAHPALLAAIGVSPASINEIVQMRRIAPIEHRTAQQMFPAPLPSGIQLRAGNDGAYTIKATARPRRPDGQLSDYRRTVAALLTYDPRTEPQVSQWVVRQWYEVSTTETPWPAEPRPKGADIR